MSASPTDPMVSAEALIAQFDAPDMRIVEATWFAPFTNPEKTGRETYEEGHIPGAVFFDIDEIADASTDLPHMLPSPVQFSSRVRKMGLGDGNRIVVYDRNDYMAAARVWWMFRAMGHQDVRVLDGGLTAWTRAGGDLEDLPPVPVERHFTARVRSSLVKTLEQMDALVGADSHTVFDARPPGRFTGEAPEPRTDLPSGHMPGARNVPAGNLVNEDGTLKSKTELETLFGDTSGPLVTSCGSGVTAATLALALARLGRDDVAVYDGSWTEWASAGSRTIATGAPA